MRNPQETRRARTTRRLAGVAALAMAFVAQHAGAVTLSPHGIGQALIYPYYTVNKNQDTLVSVTNTDDVGKAIQMRFREGYNGRDTLSFVLFLAAHDTWTASLSAAGEDQVRITTSDDSCTLPSFPPEGTNFRSAGYDGSGEIPADGGPTDFRRTREGFLEMIVGGDVVAGTATQAAITQRPNMYPPSCTIDAGSFVSDLEDSSGGIYGTSAIVDVANGTFFGYNADALAGLSPDVMFAAGNPYPGPTLADASSNDALHGVARAYVETSGGAVAPISYATGIDAVSAVFMADAIYNDYLVSDSLGAATDWVVTFPTKQFYVDSLYGNVPKPPFDHAFTNGGAEVAVTGSIFDREQTGFDFGESCEPQCYSSLMYQTNVVAIGGFAPDFTSRVLGSELDSLALAVNESGSAIMRLSDTSGARVLRGTLDLPNGQDLSLHGLPVTGFMVYNIVNANAAPGVLANYSGAFPHRRSVD